VSVRSREILSGFREDSVPVPSTGEACRLFTATPEDAGPWPALMIFHSAFGIDDHLREVALDFVRQGYVVAIPDLYCNDADYANHQWEHIEAAAHLRASASGGDPLAAFSPSDRERIGAAGEWLARRKPQLFPGYAKACFGQLRADARVSAIGCLGYCMGGKLAGTIAAEGLDLAAAVVFYGAPPPLETVGRIQCPIEGHYAKDDHGITGKVPAFDAAMRAAGKHFTYFVYEAQHGFSLSSRLKCYDATASRQSMLRAKAFLAKHLSASGLKPL
jgi:carboxymethylenebutenolidase